MEMKFLLLVYIVKGKKIQMLLKLQNVNGLLKLIPVALGF